MLHLAIMKARPEVVGRTAIRRTRRLRHCREPIPQCVIPEVEICLGDVPITKYAIPGGQESPTRFCRSSTSRAWYPGQPTVSYGETVGRPIGGRDP